MIRTTSISKDGKNRELDIAGSMLRDPDAWTHNNDFGAWHSSPEVITAHAMVSIAQSLKDIVTELRGIRKDLRDSG